MIRYTLVCDGGHGFESWFPSSESYDDQAARGLVSCPVCDSARVTKGVMAPSIARGDRAAARTAPGPEANLPAPNLPASHLPAAVSQPEPMTMLAEPEQRLRALLRAVREQVTKSADDVGPRFPEEARRIHYGESPARPIYGEASLDEALALVEEGIDVAPLPPMPDDRN